MEFYVGGLTGNRIARGRDPWLPADPVAEDVPVMDHFAAMAKALYHMAMVIEGFSWGDATIDRINSSVLAHQNGIARIGREAADKFDALLPDHLQQQIDESLGG